jgi:hypothetical protein
VPEWELDGNEWRRFSRPGIDPSGASVLTTSYGLNGNEAILPTLFGSNQQAYSGNAVVFGAILARLSLFSEATFAFRDLSTKDLSGSFERDGRRNTALRKLEDPWPNGTTGELLARMIQDVDLAGNAYIWDAGDQLVRLRPDWVTIVSEMRLDPNGREYREVVGYYYEPPVMSQPHPCGVRRAWNCRRDQRGPDGGDLLELCAGDAPVCGYHDASVVAVGVCMPVETGGGTCG